MPCQNKLKGGNYKMPKVRVKGHLMKIPGKRKKTRVKGHLRKVTRNKKK